MRFIYFYFYFFKAISMGCSLLSISHNYSQYYLDCVTREEAHPAPLLVTQGADACVLL